MPSTESPEPGPGTGEAPAGFTNLPVDESALPRADDLHFEGLAANYVRVLLLETALAWGVIVTGALVTAFFVENVARVFGQWWFLTPLALLIAFSFVWPPLLARSRGFVLRARDFHYRSGVIWQKTVSLPYNRIQHVEMESGPLERLFKLTTLKFYTSGGGKADMKIPALTFERGSRLRAHVIAKAAQDKPSEGPSNDGH